MALKVEHKGLRSLKAAFWLASPKLKDSATFTLRCLPTSFTGASGTDSPSMCTKTRRRGLFTWEMNRTTNDIWSKVRRLIAYYETTEAKMVARRIDESVQARWDGSWSRKNLESSRHGHITAEESRENTRVPAPTPSRNLNFNDAWE